MGIYSLLDMIKNAGNMPNMPNIDWILYLKIVAIDSCKPSWMFQYSTQDLIQ